MAGLRPDEKEEPAGIESLPSAKEGVGGVGGTAHEFHAQLPDGVPKAASRKLSLESQHELASVRQRLQEAEEILRAIQNDEIDALAIRGMGGPRISTLEGAEHPYRVLVETINEGAMTLSGDGRILYCNPALAKLLGSSQEQIVGMRMQQAVQPRDMPLFEALLSRGIREGSKGELDLVVNEQSIPVLMSFSALDIKGLQCACSIVTDLREQKRNEEILASERLTNSILEQAAEAIIVCDAATLITRANKQARMLCGRNPLLANFDEVFTLYTADGPIAANLQAESSANRLLSVKDILGGKTYVSQEVLYQRPREELRSHLLISAGPLRGRDGTITGCVVTLSDITLRKQIEQAQAQLLVRERQARADAQAANQAKDMFLATLSHELRTPLSAVLGWVRLLREAPNEKMMQKAVDVIDRNARMQAQLIDDILDISRIISGKIALEPRVLNLVSVITAAIESVRLAVEAKNIRIATALGTEPALVVGDAARLQQVVWNLLSNAAKFTPNGGHIEVALSSDGRTYLLRVTDTGQGIEKDFLPFVFDRFRQADGSHARRYGGLGLGLAIVRHLVEMHGGSVTVSSPGKDRGATFTVQLPCSQKTPATGEEISSPERVHAHVKATSDVLAGLHLLIVDDQADTLEFLTMALEQQGATVSTASSAEEALRILEQASFLPDVLLSDIAMPGGDGYHLIHRLRRREASGQSRKIIPAIALTAFARAVDAEDALQAGFQRHITKPVDIAELTAAVVELSGRRSPSYR